MANDAKKVVVGKPKASGGAYSAPITTAVPADLKSALAADFKGVGYVSADGLVQSISADSSEIVAWGGDTVRKVQTKHDLSYALTMIETNASTSGIYYGAGNVAVTAATVSSGELVSITITSAELEHRVWVFELMDGTRSGRVILPDAQVTDRGDVSFVDGDAVSYGLTLTAYPDADGVKAYVFWDDGVLFAV